MQAPLSSKDFNKNQGTATGGCLQCICTNGPNSTKRCRDKSICNQGTDTELEKEADELRSELLANFDHMTQERGKKMAYRLADLRICSVHRGRKEEVATTMLEQLEQEVGTRSARPNAVNRAVQQQSAPPSQALRPKTQAGNVAPAAGPCARQPSLPPPISMPATPIRPQPTAHASPPPSISRLPRHSNVDTTNYFQLRRGARDEAQSPTPSVASSRTLRGDAPVTPSHLQRATVQPRAASPPMRAPLPGHNKVDRINHSSVYVGARTQAPSPSPSVASSQTLRGDVQPSAGHHPNLGALSPSPFVPSSRLELAEADARTLRQKYERTEEDARGWHERCGQAEAENDNLRRELQDVKRELRRVRHELQEATPELQKMQYELEETKSELQQVNREKDVWRRRFERLKERLFGVADEAVEMSGDA